MCNVPAPLRQRRRWQRARLRFRGYAAPPRAARKPMISSSIKSPSVGVTYNVSFVTVEHSSSWAREGLTVDRFIAIYARVTIKTNADNPRRMDTALAREKSHLSISISSKIVANFFFIRSIAVITKYYRITLS